MTFTAEQKEALSAKLDAGAVKYTSQEFARFWSQVAVGDDPSTCWEWIGEAFPGGLYGRFSAQGKGLRSHRVAYEMANGPLKEGEVVRHVCDNPPCCNPAHLRAGTVRDNVRDMYERGRNPDRQGSKHPLAHLNETQVIQLRRLAAMGKPRAYLAGLFGISRQHVGKIVRRENWSHV